MKSVRILLTTILFEIFLAIFLLRIEKLKMTLQKMIFKTNRKEFTTRGIPLAVTHPSTDLARVGLTSVIIREPVFSLWYGRRRR